MVAVIVVVVVVVSDFCDCLFSFVCCHLVCFVCFLACWLIRSVRVCSFVGLFLCFLAWLLVMYNWYWCCVYYSCSATWFLYDHAMLLFDSICFILLLLVVLLL
ncbi:unnamed protein product [Polarella glacialis]|uniref:Uncharacterized protein n=1 Tax=Polarella glacialis TaxID=89957 RepID=A0A813HRI8_POLGL|nr:unnamed protein product [Polarella glacialis]